MATKNYLIEYTVYGKSNEILKEGTIRAKNKENEFLAKAGFGKHIETTYGDKLGRLHIKSCKIDWNIGDIFGMGGKGKDNSFDGFGDIFGGFNPK